MIYTIRFPEDAGVKFEMFRYPAGEVQVRLLDNQLSALKKAEAVRIWARVQNGEIVALAQLCDAIEMSSCCERSLFIPYLPYGRADRAFTTGDCIGLRVFQELLGSLPVDHIYTLDMHNAQAQYGRIIRNLSPLPIIKIVMGLIGKERQILLPDEGAAQRYELEGIRCFKQRDATTGKLSGFHVPRVAALSTNSILIVDDICDGGGTFLGLAEKMPHAELYLYITHGIFSKGFAELQTRFNHIYTTDSFATLQFNKDSKFNRFLTVIPCGGTMLDAILTRDKLYQNV